MGWETAIQLGATAVQAIGTRNAAKAEASAVAREGQLEAEKKARETVRTTGKLQTSFLNSGLTMEGTPTEVISRAYQYGQEDINQIVQNANSRSKNIIKKARADILEGAISKLGGIDFGSSFGALSKTTAVGAELDSLASGNPFGSGWNTFYDVKDSISNPMNAGIF